MRRQLTSMTPSQANSRNHYNPTNPNAPPSSYMGPPSSSHNDGRKRLTFSSVAPPGPLLQPTPQQKPPPPAGMSGSGNYSAFGLMGQAAGGTPAFGGFPPGGHFGSQTYGTGGGSGGGAVHAAPQPTPVTAGRASRPSLIPQPRSALPRPPASATGPAMVPSTPMNVAMISQGGPGGGSEFAVPNTAQRILNHGGRMSMSSISSSSRRSSSIGGAGGKPGAPKSDPRPINDKFFQQNCIHGLLDFLVRNHYDHSLTVSDLQSPTTKEFYHIMQFLVHKVDPNFKYSPKPADDVAMIFSKYFNYPFPISKNALSSIGSSNTWPPILAALKWLVDLLNYYDEVERLEKTEHFGEDAMEQFNDAAGAMYRAFLEGDDASVEEMTREVSEQYDILEARQREEMQRLAEELQQLQEEVEKQRNEPTPREKLQLRRDANEREIASLAAGIAENTMLKQELESRITSLEADLQNRKAELAEMREANAVMEERVAEQAVDVEEMQRMQREKSKLSEVLREMVARREEIDSAVTKDEVDVEKLKRELERQLQEYRAAGDRLKILPASAKRANGVDCEMRFNARGTTVNEVLGVDVKGVVRPRLVALREELSAKWKKEVGEMMVSAEEANDMERRMREQEEEMAMVKINIQKAEQQEQLERKKMQQEMEALNDSIEELASTISAAKSYDNQMLAEWEQKHRAILDEKVELQRRIAREAASKEEHYLAAMSMLRSHKMQIEEMVQGTNEEMKKAIQNLSNVAALGCA